MVLSVGYIKEKWQHAGFQKYLRNTGWMFFARIITFVTSFLTISIVARYLGPENLGLLDYAQGFVAIISVFASLGIDQILYKELVNSPEKEGDLLGTAIISKLIFGAISFIVAISISIIIGNNILITTIIGLCSFTFLINPVGTVSILFNSRVQSKYSSYITIFLAIFIPILKVLLVFLNKGIIYFAIILVVESIINSVWALRIYVNKFNCNPFKWRFRSDIFLDLMKKSWPLLLAGFSGYIYAKIDLILILHYLNPLVVGIYSAAVKITQIWAFLPGLIIGSLFPAILNAKKHSFQLYAKRFKKLSSTIVLISIIIALPLYIFAPFVIKIIYGSAFIDAFPILRIYLWTSVAISIVVLVQHFLIAENFHRVFLYSSLFGAISNVLLNIILIPRFGAIGSSIGTLFSYLFAAASVLFFKKPRRAIIDILLSKNNG